MLAVTRSNLVEIVKRALERMTFTFVETGEVRLADAIARACAHATIELRGPRSYLCSVSASVGMVQEVASGMLGCDADEVDPAKHGEAVVAELANVFGGELVIQMSTERDGLRIGLPQPAQVEQAAELGARAERDGVGAVFVLEIGELAVSLSRA